ncbi:MAG: phosphodiesterase [Paracoccaceae bacterium]|jgi:3',5'-cyclic AMP phosphodiesterase CpdA
MDKLLVFTDLHVRGVGQSIFGVDTLERLREGIEHATNLHPDAVRIVLTGDIVHSGKLLEYERVKVVLDAVDIPITLMCGNHDNRENLLAVFPDTPTSGGFLQSVVDLGDTRLIMLDTLDGPPFRNDHHSGVLCETRMEWLRNALDTATGRVLVFMHHPPHAVGFPGMDDIRLRNGDVLLALLKNHPNVAHFFAGHVHRTISGSVDGLGFSMFKSPSYQMPFDLVGANAAVSTPEPGAYGIVLLYKNRVIVHTEDFQLAEPDVQPDDEALPE